MFQLSPKELDDWMSQIATSNREKMGMRKLPFVFTEQGVAMLSSVLSSDTAIAVNIQIIRIFTRIRNVLQQHSEILLKLEQLEKRVEHQDDSIEGNEEDTRTIFKVLKQLLQHPAPERKPVGFKTKIENA
jgi:hypothetical protein